MARVRHLPHAPIIEALIDIRVQLPADFALARFDVLSQVLEGQYSGSEKISTMEARLGFEGGKPVPADPKYTDLGVRLKSADQHAIAQFRSNGFTFNRLEPYTSWVEIFPEAMRLWREYLNLVGHAKVTRLAVRYINRLRLPLPVPDLAKYLEAPPTVPPSLPLLVRSFLTRIVVFDGKREQSAIVTQALEPSALEPNKMMVLLDIDAFKELSLEPNDARLEAVFGDLRDFKNEIFFSSVTDEGLGLFQ